MAGIQAPEKPAPPQPEAPTTNPEQLPFEGLEDIMGEAAEVVDAKVIDPNLTRGVLERIGRAQTGDAKEIQRNAHSMRHEVSIKLQRGEQLTPEDRLNLTISFNLEKTFLEQRLLEIKQAI